MRGCVVHLVTLAFCLHIIIHNVGALTGQEKKITIREKSSKSSLTQNTIKLPPNTDRKTPSHPKGFRSTVPKASSKKRRSPHSSKKRHSNDCNAFRIYTAKSQSIPSKNVKPQAHLENMTDEVSFLCDSYDTCMRVHLNNLQQIGLQKRCNITHNISNIQDRFITFTHIPKAGGSSVHMNMDSTAELKARNRAYSDPHLPFYSQQKANPNDFYFALFRNPVNMLISFFNYVAQRKTLPPHAKCNIGWETAHANRLNPLLFAKKHHHITEGDFLHYFVPTVPNASEVLRAWPAYRDMQKLPPHDRVVKTPWISDFPRDEYLAYLSLKNNNVFPPNYRCENHVEASILLLERYAAVGTLEKLPDMYTVLYHRAQLKNRVDDSRVTNLSQKMMSNVTEALIKEMLRETMFCQTMMWKMADAISAFDIKCVEKDLLEEGNNTGVAMP